MIQKEKTLVFDIDGTLCGKPIIAGNYETAEPFFKMIDKLNELRIQGFYIILHTSRQMRTYEGNVGRITANTLPTLVRWLDKYDVPYDEIHVGKPWCGVEGYYVDDRAIRPSEFIELSHEEIVNLLKQEKQKFEGKLVGGKA